MNITVIGAGNSGLAMAAHLSHFGHQVTLWNRTEKNILELSRNRMIRCSGIIEGDVILSCVTSDIKIAVNNTDLILITTPANSIEYLSKILAKNMRSTVPIILNPGRTFGALRFSRYFREMNTIIEPIIAETQTIIYTCRKMNENEVVIYSLKKKVQLAGLSTKSTKDILLSIPSCLRPYFVNAKSFLDTSLGNVGMILHCAPLLFNAGWTENGKTDYKYYYDGITETIGNFIERLDIERLAVGEKLGCNLLSTKDWMIQQYRTDGDSLYECIANNDAYKEIDAPKSLKHRYIYEDIPYGLVPLEKIGLNLGLPMTYTTLVIDVANKLLQEDFRQIGDSIDLKTIQDVLRAGEY